MKLYCSISAVALATLAACSDAPNAQASAELSAETPENTAEVPSGTQTQGAGDDKTPIEAVAVRVGLDGPDFDACGGYGQVTGLNPQGDNFLSVRSAPTVAAEEVDRLPQGAGVSMCDHADGWIGIVYQAQGIDDPNCETGSPALAVTPYDGPCRSGWVSERFVELIAG